MTDESKSRSERSIQPNRKRDLRTTLLCLQRLIPESETGLQAGISSILSSIAYTPPEFEPEMWGRLVQLLESAAIRAGAWRLEAEQLERELAAVTLMKNANERTIARMQHEKDWSVSTTRAILPATGRAIEDALWLLHSYESNRDDAGRVYSEIEISNMVEAVRAATASAIQQSKPMYPCPKGGECDNADLCEIKGYCTRQ